jgi:hypothetical protein
MPDCCNGKRQTPDRTHQHGSPTSGRDFHTAKSSSSLSKKTRTQARLPVRVAVTLCQFVRQAMAYKEAKPQSLVRIIASIVARVM